MQRLLIWKLQKKKPSSIMIEFDEFSLQLLEEAKRFLEKAMSEDDKEGQVAYLHASLVMGFSALEAFVNGIADELLIGSKINILEQSVLSERYVRLSDGKFQLQANQVKYFRLEDRIQFLYRRHKKKAVDKNSEWWRDLKAGLELRNRLVHPREKHALVYKQVEATLKAIIKTIDVLFKAIYHTGFPSAGTGINSSMTF